MPRESTAMTTMVLLLGSSIASLTVSNGSSPPRRSQKSGWTRMRWQFSSRPLHGKDLPFETIDFCSLPSLHLRSQVCVILDDMTEGSMRRRPKEHSSGVISGSTFNGHRELLPAQGLVKEDPRDSSKLLPHWMPSGASTAHSKIDPVWVDFRRKRSIQMR